MNKQGCKSKYSDEIVEFVRNHVKNYTDKEIAQMVSEKWNMVVNRSNIQNLKGRRGIRSGIKRGCYPKGNVPINKGTKGMFNVGGNKTSFKKGDTPYNLKPIGSERVTKDGYVDIKVANPNKWRLKHHVIWEQHYGEKPKKDENIIFRDGNAQNLSIENMMLVTDGELGVLNRSRLIYNDAELTNIGVNIARVKMAINKNKKKGSKRNERHL